jgi:hypothetical protein
VAICAWVAAAVAWTRAIASACSVEGMAADATGISGFAVTFPAGGVVLLSLVEQVLKV